MLRQKFDHDNENVFWYILKQVWYKDCLQFLQFLLIVVSNKRASLLITFEKKIYPTKGILTHASSDFSSRMTPELLRAHECSCLTRTKSVKM